jgi:hypothetical protein
MVNGCYTEKELRDIQTGAQRYDKLSAEQSVQDEKRLADTLKRAMPSTIWAVELYDLLEQENTGFISEAHKEIGTLRTVKERFADNSRIQQFCDYFIRCALCEIEELMNEVKYGREAARELAKL